MAPGTRRANRSGYAEHDDFEGLPVRQWRQEWVNVAPPLPQEPLQQNDVWAIELIHGMPKDSTLLAPHSQELLRAARSGRLYKRPAPAEEEETETEVAPTTDKNEKKEEETAVKGFSIKLWKQIPRNNEGSGLSHLAKRRKNTVTVASRTIEEKATGPTVTRATVRRMDAAGNPYTEEVTLADGQQVVGEIIATRVETAPAPPADTFVAPPPPPRRRPHPPKRKSKAGPGRGKKKNKNTLPGEARPAGVAPAGAGAATLAKIEGQGEMGAGQESVSTPNPDSEMADGDEDDDDDDGDDNEDGEDDDQEDGEPQGDDVDGSRIQDEEMTDVVDEAKPPTPIKPVIDAMDGVTQTEVMPPSPLTFAPPLASLAAPSPKPEGSPLKNVVLQSPAEAPSQAPLPPAADEAPASEPVSVPETQAATSSALDHGRLSDSESKEEPMIIDAPSTAAGVEDKAAADIHVPADEASREEFAVIGELPEQGQSEEVRRAPSPPKIPKPDVVSRKEALLPPPHEQVGNISSPKADEGQDRVSDSEDKSREGHHSEVASGSERPPTQPQDSVLNEDTIKPEDSASVRFPLTESGAPSEVGTASVEDVRDSAVATAEPIEKQPKEPSSPKQTTPVAGVKEDTPLADSQPVAEKLEDSKVLKEETLQTTSAPQPDPMTTKAAPVPEVLPPAPESEPLSEAKEGIPSTSVLAVPHNEPASTLKEPDETSREDAATQGADVVMGEVKEEPSVDQTLPAGEESAEVIKDEPMQESADEQAPVPQPAPIHVSEETPTVPAPVAEALAAEATPEAQSVTAQEEKEDPPAGV